MTLPKSWADVKSRQLARQSIEWDGVKTSETINIPIASHPLHIAVDNVGLGRKLILTLEHLLRMDDGKATVTIGEGANGTYTVTTAAAGPAEHFIQHILPKDPSEATNVTAVLTEKTIVVTLAVDADGTPDDTKNTATLIAAAVNNLEGFTAEAGGTGAGTFSKATAVIPFVDTKVPVYATLYDTNGNQLAIEIADNTRKVYGPFLHFPRFMGGRISLANATAPNKNGVTIVQIVEG